MDNSTGDKSHLRIALVGANLAAKNSVGRQMQYRHNFKFVRMTDGYRLIRRMIYQTSDRYHYDWTFMYKFYDALYEVDPNIWVQYLERRLKRQGKDWVVPDVRFKSEVVALRDMGFQFIRITHSSNKPFFGPSVITKPPGKIKLMELYSPSAYDALINTQYSIDYEDLESTRKALEVVVRRIREDK